MQIAKSLKTFLTDYDRPTLPWEEKAVAQILTSFQASQATYPRADFLPFVREGYARIPKVLKLRKRKNKNE